MTEQTALPEGLPPLNQYYVYLTAGCNLACRHCWLSPVYQPKGTTGGHLDFDLFKLALEEGLPLGLQHVKLTGGEPLLHPDFLRMVDLLKKNDLGLTIETNGTLMMPEIARHLRENSTLEHISISMDGAKAETHDAFRGVAGSFQKAVAGLQMLVEVGYCPQVIMSVHGGNTGEIEQLVRLAESWGAGSVKFNLIQPSGRGESMAERGQTLDIRRMVELGQWIEHELQKSVSIDLLYSWPMIFHSLDRLLKHGSDSCGIFNILGILANGSLAMCGIGLEIPQLTYGQLGKDRVLDVWRDNRVLQDLRRDLPGKLEGVCAECLFKNQCLGSCVAQNYYQAQRLTAPFWFCQKAYELGILPTQRMKTEAPTLNEIRTVNI
jgi:SynChlorMet cassette radical SAM/SPASM protein ScmF